MLYKILGSTYVRRRYLYSHANLTRHGLLGQRSIDVGGSCVSKVEVLGVCELGRGGGLELEIKRSIKTRYFRSFMTA